MALFDRSDDGEPEGDESSGEAGTDSPKDSTANSGDSSQESGGQAAGGNLDEDLQEVLENPEDSTDLDEALDAALSGDDSTPPTNDSASQNSLINEPANSPNAHESVMDDQSIEEAVFGSNGDGDAPEDDSESKTAEAEPPSASPDDEDSESASKTAEAPSAATDDEDSETPHDESVTDRQEDGQDEVDSIIPEPDSGSTDEQPTEEPEAPEDSDIDTGDEPESPRTPSGETTDQDDESSGSFLSSIGLNRFSSSSSDSADHGSVFERDENGELHVPSDILEDAVKTAGEDAVALNQTVDERTVDVNEDLDEDDFFSTLDGHTTVVNRYDLEKAVPIEKKRHFYERERYWVNKPYAFVVIFHSRKENESKYYLIEPYLTGIEEELRDFLTGKLRTAIKYESEEALADKSSERATVIERETRRLLTRYDLYEEPDTGIRSSLRNAIGLSGSSNGDSAPDQNGSDDLTDFIKAPWRVFGDSNGEDPEPESVAPTTTNDGLGDLDGLSVRPEGILLVEDDDTLSEYQVEKLLYMLRRDFVGYERIDGIKHDINVEDISCDGYNSPVFVYHTDYENIISNVYHGEQELDEFVVKLAQRSGKGISKRQPQVDATLPDGSRSQLTLGQEVSDHGTNYTIRQFKDVPFTPIDLINWRTFSLDQMAFLWLAIESHKSLIFAGGTASGKTTSLNAVSLFIPSNTKIVSIEDTREVELPQRNWIASVTRPSFSDDEQGDIDEFDLLEAALRQRPDYIVMGEIRGEEGRTLFQVMSTGHTTYTTFHADSVGEVLKRFTTEPINVSKTLFTALDLVSIQTQTRVKGQKVRKSKSITEINEYNAENDEINVQDVYQWRAETDTFEEVGRSNVLDQIMFDRGWSHEELSDELFKRRVVLAYLVRTELNEYAQVAATVQAFISDPETVLGLIANGELEARLEDLREMESVEIDIEPEKEELVPRPDPDSEVYELAGDILDEAERRLFDEYEDSVPDTKHLEQALATTMDQSEGVQAHEAEE